MADQTGFDWKTPVHQRVSAIILAVLVAAVIAVFAYAIVRFARPYPTRFDHSTWIHHPDWRRFMLNDLLTDQYPRGHLRSASSNCSARQMTCSRVAANQPPWIGK